MIGSCDCCDRQHVPVSKFNATGAYPEGNACFICRGDTDPDPYGELEAQGILTDIWFHFSATDDPTLRSIADRARALLDPVSEGKQP